MKDKLNSASRRSKKGGENFSLKGLLGKWRNQVDGTGLKEILGNFDL
jgi:hypothetical protein